MSQLTLILETSGRIGRVGLADASGVFAETALDETRRHARDLTPSIERILTQHGRRIADLTGVTVGIGPGSYTGLRVGLTTAKSLAYATGLDLIAVPTFEGLAWQAPESCSTLHLVADALQGLLYTQTLNRRDRLWHSATALQIQERDAWFRTTKYGDCIGGPGISVLSTELIQHPRMVMAECLTPTLAGLWRAASIRGPVTRSELFALEPLYLRGSSAEEKANARDRARAASSP